MTELEKQGRLLRVAQPVSLVHEITEIHRRVLAEGGPALLFERPVRSDGAVSEIPLLANLFGTRERIELGYGIPAARLAISRTFWPNCANRGRRRRSGMP